MSPLVLEGIGPRSSDDLQSSASSLFPFRINDELKVSLIQSGDYVQLGLTGYIIDNELV